MVAPLRGGQLALERCAPALQGLQLGPGDGDSLDGLRVQALALGAGALTARPLAAALDAAHIAAIAAAVVEQRVLDQRSRLLQARIARYDSSREEGKGRGNEQFSLTYAVATRFRSSGATFFLRGFTGRRCSGDGAAVEGVSGFADGCDGLVMVWHRAGGGKIGWVDGVDNVAADGFRV
jgi:hypothetical protein